MVEIVVTAEALGVVFVDDDEVVVDEVWERNEAEEVEAREVTEVVTEVVDEVDEIDEIAAFPDNLEDPEDRADPEALELDEREWCDGLLEFEEGLLAELDMLTELGVLGEPLVFDKFDDEVVDEFADKELDESPGTSEEGLEV